VTGDRVPFWKMSGAGNDFVLLDGIGGAVARLDGAWIAAVCTRGTGIGADGLIVLEPGDRAPIRMRHWNADGLENPFCGNGTRCAARLAFLRGYAGREFTLETGAGTLEARVLAGERVSIEAPRVPAEIRPMRITLDGGGAPREIAGAFVETGVPHFVLEVPDVSEVDPLTAAPPIRRHPAFGAPGTNVDFVRRRAPDRLDIRTFERGVEGETLSCGSGAIAAALWAWSQGAAGDTVTLMTRSGAPLTVRREAGAQGGRLRLEGDARMLCRGEIFPGEFAPPAGAQ